MNEMHFANNAKIQAELRLEGRPPAPEASNMSREDFMAGVRSAQERMQAGDIFQLVLSQRFQRRTLAEPFEIYRCAFLGAMHLPLHNKDHSEAILFLLISPSGKITEI